MSPRQRAALREGFGVKQALTSGWDGEMGVGKETGPQPLLSAAEVQCSHQLSLYL